MTKMDNSLNIQTIVLLRSFMSFFVSFSKKDMSFFGTMGSFAKKDLENVCGSMSYFVGIRFGEAFKGVDAVPKRCGSRRCARRNRRSAKTLREMKPLAEEQYANDAPRSPANSKDPAMAHDS